MDRNSGGAKDEAIPVLMTQKNVEEATRSVGISTPTLLRWLKVPEFNDAYRDARRTAFQQATARLQYASSAAVSGLLKVLVDPATPASARVRAADCILNHAKAALSSRTLKHDFPI
jgi:hypothetical protein